MSDVSVIVPTRDRWSTIGRTLASALGQRDVEIELIVVDDGSATSAPPDPVWSDPRVRLIRRDRSGGPSAARNTGAEASHSEWLAWLDDDDLWAPDKLARQLRAAQAAGGVMAYTSAIVADERLQPLIHCAAPPAEGLAAALVNDVSIPAGSSNVLARRESVVACGGWDTTLDHLADWDMWLRLAREGPAAACDETLLAYMMHGENRHLQTDELMAEFEVLRARHADWAASAGTGFDRAKFARYPTSLLIARHQPVRAIALAIRTCVRSPRPSSVRYALGGLAGPRLRRFLRRAGTGSDCPPAPAWLA
jgi:glycosyltransferase involved in cell wall biosynthesis